MIEAARMTGPSVRAMTIRERASTRDNPEFWLSLNKRAHQIVKSEGRFCDETGCIFVDRAHDNRGYPVIKSQGVQVKIVQALALPPPGFHSRHLCGMQSCINPNHIEPGTAQENSDDRILHGTLPFGDQVHNARLTNDDVREIRTAPDTVKNGTLAARFDVSKSLVQAVRTGTAHAHLNDAIPPIKPAPRVRHIETKGGTGTDAEVEQWHKQALQRVADYINAHGIRQASGCLLNPRAINPPTFKIHGRRLRVSALLAGAERTQPICGDRMCINPEHWLPEMWLGKSGQRR